MAYIIKSLNKDSGKDGVLTTKKHLLYIANADAETFKEVKFFNEVDDAITMLESAHIIRNFSAVDFGVFEAEIDKTTGLLNIKEQCVYSQNHKETKRIALDIKDSLHLF